MGSVRDLKRHNEVLQVHQGVLQGHAKALVAIAARVAAMEKTVEQLREQLAADTGK